jgi:hypothetical protein
MIITNRSADHPEVLIMTPCDPAGKRARYA